MNTLKATLVSIGIASALLVALASCSDDSDNEQTKDAATVADAALDASAADLKIYPDLGLLPDIGIKLPCESEWRDAISPQDTVSTGAVSTTDLGGGVKQTTIDATAGGMNEAHNNPFVYISLADGSRVDINDVDARSATTWDLAFRRTVIRINGGDSGVGQGAVSIQANKTLDQVTEVPPENTFHTDEFLDDDCNVQTNAIGAIKTAFGSDGMWYDFDSSTMRVVVNPDTYVVRTADGNHVKVFIDSYYSTTDVSAHFTIRWSQL